MSREMQKPRDDSEMGELVTLVKRTLHRYLDTFIEDGGVPGHIRQGCGQGTYGALRDASSYGITNRGVHIYKPSSLELSTAQVWHDFCDEKGYPTGERAGADGYPPHPAHDGEGVWIAITWASARQEMLATARAATEPEQLSLLDLVAA